MQTGLHSFPKFPTRNTTTFSTAEKASPKASVVAQEKAKAALGILLAETVKSCVAAFPLATGRSVIQTHTSVPSARTIHSRQSGSSNFGGFAAPATEEGPLGDLLGGPTRVYMMQETATPLLSENANAATRVTSDPAGERLPGIWQTTASASAELQLPAGLSFLPSGASLFQPPIPTQSPDAAAVANHLNRMGPRDLSIVASLLLPTTLSATAE